MITNFVFFAASTGVTLAILIQRDKNKAKELEQLASLVQWLQGDETGWHKLRTSKLLPAVRSVIEHELLFLQKKRSIAGSSKEKELEKRLGLLLISPSELSNELHLWQTTQYHNGRNG